MKGERKAQGAPSKIEIERITPAIGAEVRGVKLGGGLEHSVVEELKAALLKHKVLFFRGQHHLDDEEHQRFASLLGPIVRHPTAGHRSAINIIDGKYSWARASNWHSDVTFRASYTKATLLRPVTLPSCGGDTVWANTVTAYESMPSQLRALAGSLWGIHSNMGDFVPYRPDFDSEENRRYAKQFQSVQFVSEHPLVRVIPETEEPAMVLGGHFRYFVGVSREDTAHLFQLFQSYITRPENTVRWRWRPGDLVIWENRTTQHRAVDDYGAEPRLMHGVTIEGDLPRSLDGRTSVERLGPASTKEVA